VEDDEGRAETHMVLMADEGFRWRTMEPMRSAMMCGWCMVSGVELLFGGGGDENVGGGEEG
jgi:hypothetical protein